jgi:hypothetical protein
MTVTARDMAAVTATRRGRRLGRILAAAGLISALAPGFTKDLKAAIWRG